MSEIFLRSVELSNFRVYGDSYAFDLPDEPSVTLITGGNGLGKTSFFDGVEWALTGQVSRFSDIQVDGRRKELDPLTRVGAPANSHRVSLAFTAGAPIDRGAGFVPSEDEIATLLKEANWPQISSLHGYLSITHFLGQAATRRFSLREPKSQWEALKGPAGVDRINNLRERVSGQGARQAFTRAIRDRSEALNKASAALNDWRNLLADRDRLQLLSSSERSISPRHVLDEVERLAQLALTIMPEARWLSAGVGAEPEAVLSQLASLLESAEAALRNELARVLELGRILTAFDEAKSEAAAKSTVAKDILARRTALVDELARAEAQVAQAAAAHSRLEELAAQIQSRSALLARAAAAVEQLDRSATAMREADRQLKVSQDAADRALALRDEAQRKSHAATMLREERNRISNRLADAQRRAELSTSLARVRSEIARLRPLVSAFDADALRSTRASITSDAKDAAVEIDRLTDELRRHDDRARAIAEAVSIIAHQISHDDQSCPICATNFKPGQLKSLALAHATAEAAPAADLANALAAARLRREDAARRIAEVDRNILEHEQLMSVLSTERSREAQLERQLIATGGSPDADYGDADVTSLRLDLAGVDSQIAAGPTQDVIDVMLAEAQTGIEAERVKRVSLERQRTDAAADVEAARSFLSRHTDLWSSEAGLLVSLDAERSTALDGAATVGEQLRDDQKRLDAARVARDELSAAIAREDASLVGTNRDLDKLSERCRGLALQWTEAGQSGEPDNTFISHLRSSIAERQLRLAPISSALTNLISGFRVWQSDQELQARERSVQAMLETRKVDKVEAATRQLQDEIDAAQRQLSLAQSARDRMEDVGSRMQERAERFADDVLKPLNDTIQRFAHTLMNWTDASIVYRAEHYATRSELRSAILRTAVDGTTTQLEMNPNLFFSEGQLSALSVSALLAASTTFSWSRRRGLLLDDPLQHNDVIHASAFMDLLRQMVRKLRYQVILSTHDSTEAEFLVRKCRSSGIRFAVHELLPRGEDGLISAVA